MIITCCIKQRKENRRREEKKLGEKKNLGQRQTFCLFPSKQLNPVKRISMPSHSLSLSVSVSVLSMDTRYQILSVSLASIKIIIIAPVINN